MLIVEDGSGLANADAFVSLAECDAYHDARENLAWFTSENSPDAAIRRATAWVSTHFNWKGYPVRNRLQALAWPRYEVYDREGWYVLSDSVPQEVRNATCEAALLELVTPGVLSPVVTLTDRVKSERVGPIAVEYVTAGGASASRPVVTLIGDMLRGLTRGGAGIVGRAVRG